MAAGGVTVTHGPDGDRGPVWTAATGPVHPGLAGVARGYTGYTERHAGPLRRREPATGQVTLIVSFGDPLDIVEMSESSSGGRRLTSFVVGLHDGYAVTEHAGVQAGIQVDLTPLGAAAVLGIPPTALANECVPLDDVLGRAAGELADRLASAPAWADRFALLDRLLLERTADAPPPDPAVAWAWDQLARSGGQVPVGLLAEEIGWSRRHFGARFRAEVGLPPKPAARVLRFTAAARRLAAGTGGSIADVAAAGGYADHSHLVREFRRLAGCTPSQLAAEEVAFVQAGEGGAPVPSGA